MEDYLGDGHSSLVFPGALLEAPTTLIMVGDIGGDVDVGCANHEGPTIIRPQVRGVEQDEAR